MIPPYPKNSAWMTGRLPCPWAVAHIFSLLVWSNLWVWGSQQKTGRVIKSPRWFWSGWLVDWSQSFSLSPGFTFTSLAFWSRCRDACTSTCLSIISIQSFFFLRYICGSMRPSWLSLLQVPPLGESDPYLSPSIAIPPVLDFLSVSEVLSLSFTDQWLRC